jgi:prepilin-type N-terminal cleavage/methylation domain-containing protein
MKASTNQKGFGVVEVIIVLVVLALIAVGGWYVWRAQNRGDESQKSGTNQTSDKYAGWKTYTDTVGRFSLKHPADWTATSTRDESDPERPTVTARITSPSGTELFLNSTYGARGGACFPEPNDKPFQAGNACPSFEYLSAEKLSVGKLYASVLDEQGQHAGIKDGDAYLVTTHYAKADGTGLIYAVGVTASTNGAPAIKQPKMGAILTTTPILQRTDAKGTALPEVQAYAKGNSAAFLDSQDVATIKEALRSFVVAD